MAKSSLRMHFSFSFFLLFFVRRKYNNEVETSFGICCRLHSMVLCSLRNFMLRGGIYIFLLSFSFGCIMPRFFLVAGFVVFHYFSLFPLSLSHTLWLVFFVSSLHVFVVAIIIIVDVLIVDVRFSRPFCRQIGVSALQYITSGLLAVLMLLRHAAPYSSTHSECSLRL